MILARPFKDRILNVFMISVELCIFICYLCSGCFLKSDIDQEILMWFIIGSISSSYLLHSLLSYYKIFAILYPVIRGYFTRRALNKVDTMSTKLKDKRLTNK